MPRAHNRELPPVARRVKELRDRKFLTQEQLSAAAGVPAATLKDIERGAVTRPRNKTITALAAALDVSPQHLLFGED